MREQILGILRTNFAFILIMFTFSACTIYGEKEEGRALAIQQELVGKWIAWTNPNFKWEAEFTEDGYYNMYLVSESGRKVPIDDIRHNQLTYKIACKTDRTNLLIYDEENSKLFANYTIERHGAKLYVVSYKMIDGITHHIDEYSCWNKDIKLETVSHNDSKENMKIVFKEGFKGLALIAFEDKAGVPPQKDDDNLSTFKIDRSGILKTEAKPNPLLFAKNEVVYVIEKQDGTQEKVEMISSNRSIDAESMKNLDSNKLYIMNFGFNQIDRPRVNVKLFKAVVENDVLFLAIGKPSELTIVWKETTSSL